jgi:hypothetical protein
MKSNIYYQVTISGEILQKIETYAKKRQALAAGGAYSLNHRRVAVSKVEYNYANGTHAKERIAEWG